ncbi:hypothetical protein B0T19DRAFT_45002 [Cercophora scortea]|uniref:Uncharacterized protein n=1 Tax=Cercophora scortea TaxID=314031 RepID=A0AAE0J499_9PEZI|nr:hypothetical protein B0T19DRAFT_45002 [Cercophora scortea]
MAGGASIKLPQFSQTDLRDFHEAHFSKTAIERFGADFFRPLPQAAVATEPDVSHPAEYAAEEEYDYDCYEEEEGDGLGYYPDGVRRTLTDDQIAIFRHSELEALRRKNESARLKRGITTTTTTTHEVEVEVDPAVAAYLSEGEISSGEMPAKKKKKSNNKRKRGRNGGNKGGEEPVDLRKRTWDVVDQGLPTLDYGDEEGGMGEKVIGRGETVQRRRISYED